MRCPVGEAVIAKADSTVCSVADLKGKRIALQRGSSSRYLLILALAKAGLNVADVQPVFLTPCDARAAFERGAVDAWINWDPHFAIVQAASAVRVIAPVHGVDATVLEVAQRRARFGTVPMNAPIAAHQQHVADVFLELKFIPRRIDVKARAGLP